MQHGLLQITAPNYLPAFSIAQVKKSILRDWFGYLFNDVLVIEGL
jgi:hypothetical protein